MSFSLAIAFAGFPPGTCYPSTPAELAAMITEQLQVTGFGDLNTFNYGPSIPSPDLQDRPWIKTDAENTIIGIFTFANGQWVQSYPWVTGDILMYNAAIATAQPPFYDCDGSTVVVNGSSFTLPNLMGTVPICKGQRTLPTGSTDTATNYTASATGGRETLALIASNIPAHPHTLQGILFQPSVVGADLSQAIPEIGLSRDQALPGYIQGGNSTGYAADGVTPNPPTPANVLPPYFVLGFKMFINPNV
jgi:microcystin-dependent protein